MFKLDGNCTSVWYSKDSSVDSVAYMELFE